MAGGLGVYILNNSEAAKVCVVGDKNSERMSTVQFPGMTDSTIAQNSAPASSAQLPLLLILFFGSGCAALIYEVIWYQLLELVIGSSAVSLGVLLATFMGGLCLGSLLLPRFVERVRHPLKVYGFLELGIALCAAVVLAGVPYAGRLYASAVGYGLPSVLLRALLCSLFLLPPTVMMGATLPAIARWVENTPRGASWLGFFYGGNTAGAVFGCLLAGFYLLRVYDVTVASLCAMSINGAVGLAGLALARASEHRVSTAGANGAEADQPEKTSAVYWVIALSGFTALGAEVIWTRQLSLLLGATVYTFSIILAVFLLGIGLGSGVGAALARQLRRPRLALGACQMLIAATAAWAAFAITSSLPYWPVNASLAENPWFNFQLDLVRCLWAVLPAALFWGASFPLALAAAIGREEDSGRTVGKLYASNTVGAVLGSLFFSVVLIPAAGTYRSAQALVILAAISAMLAFWAYLQRTRIAWRATAAAGVLGIGVLLCLSVRPVPWQMLAYGRQMLTSSGGTTPLETAEGRNASIAITQWTDGRRLFHVSGKVEASSEPHDMRLQRMLGHLPALMHPGPKSVLVVGFGAGVTAGSFVLYPTVERIVICEIEPKVPELAMKYFARENHNVLNDPRVELVVDDARHYVLTSREKFDIITSDPVHPWVKGSATLYSKEYFEMCRRRLNPGGIMTQWLPLYESNLEAVKSELATFFDVFPNGVLWGNDVDGMGYDSVMMGWNGPASVPVDLMQQRLHHSDYRRVTEALGEVGYYSAFDLLATYAGQAGDLKEWLRDATINRDRNLRLQYLAGLGLNLQRAGAIYSSILERRNFPEGLFQGSENSLATLVGMFGRLP